VKFKPTYTAKVTDLADDADFTIGNGPITITMDASEWLNIVGMTESTILTSLPIANEDATASMIGPAIEVYRAVSDHYREAGNAEAVKTLENRFMTLHTAAGIYGVLYEESGGKASRIYAVITAARLVKESFDKAMKMKAAEAANGKKTGRHEPRTDLS